MRRERLAAAGIVPGQQFERAILLDLYRTGDAFSRGGEFAEAVLADLERALGVTTVSARRRR